MTREERIAFIGALIDRSAAEDETPSCIACRYARDAEYMAIIAMLMLIFGIVLAVRP